VFTIKLLKRGIEMAMFDFSFFANPMFIIGVSTVFIIAFAIFFLKREILPSLGRILYMSEMELIGNELSVTKITPKRILTKDGKRFFRIQGTRAYNFRIRRKNVLTWLGKVGTAYLFKPEDTPEGKAKKIGSFYDGLTCILGENVVKQMRPEHLEKCKESELFVTVDLEAGYTPEGLPEIDEAGVFTEQDRDMARMLGKGFQEGFKKEDWIRNAGLVGLGVALTFILQQLGILGGVT